MLGKSSKGMEDFASKPRLISLELESSEFVGRMNYFDQLRIDEQPDVPVLLPITDCSLPRLLDANKSAVGWMETYIDDILIYTQYTDTNYDIYIYIYI